MPSQVYRLYTHKAGPGLPSIINLFTFILLGTLWASQVALVLKNEPTNAGDRRDTGSIPGSGWTLGGRDDNPLQYCCLENSMDRAVWWTTVHGAQSWTWLKWLSMHLWCFLREKMKDIFCTILRNTEHLQFSSVAQSCPTLCDPMNHSTPGLLVHHHLREFIQTHVHRVSDAIQPSHPLSSLSPPAPNPSQHQGFFQWVNFLHEVAKVLEIQL